MLSTLGPPLSLPLDNLSPNEKFEMPFLAITVANNLVITHQHLAPFYRGAGIPECQT